jgi:putative ABC transport system permease protein
MQTLRALIVRLRNLFRRKQQDYEFAEEMESHLAMHIEDNLHAGMSPEEARRHALIKLGGMDRTIEEHRDRREFQWLANMQRNFRHSFRRLVKSPLPSFVIMLSLGLGIGTNTAIFSTVHHILLRSLPVEKPEELALVSVPGFGALATGQSANSDAGGPDYTFSYPAFRRLERSQKKEVSELAGFRNYYGRKITYQNQMTPGSLLMVSGGYCSLLRIQPSIGRTLVPGDDEGSGNAVAMLGYNYWQNKLGGQTAVLNQPIRVEGRVFTIVGVAPKGFQGTTIAGSPDIIIPLVASMSILPNPPGANSHNLFSIYLVARLKQGMTREQAEAIYSPVYASIVEEQIQAGNRLNPEQARQLRARRLKFLDGSRGYSRLQDRLKTPLFILIAVTGMVLLIAMANAANLLLARSAARRRELAISAAIGANRGEIARQLLSEAMMLGISGGIAAIPISLLTLRFLSFLLTQTGGSPDLLAMRLEWPVLLYGIGLSLFTGLLLGLYPALEAARVAPVMVLSQESGNISEALGTARLRKALVCTQVAISVMLLIPTGLFLKSMVSLMAVDLGFPTENLVTFQLDPGVGNYNREQCRAFFDRAERELKAIAGVSGVTATRAPLISNWEMNASVRVEGLAGPQSSAFNEIGAGFFGKIGIPLILGREFLERDNLSGQKVAIINEQFAKTLFAGQNPIGRKIGINSETSPDIEIVGVVKDSHSHSVRQTPPKTLYTPLGQSRDAGFVTFYVRSALPSDQVIAMVRKTMQSIDARILPEDLRTMKELVSRSIADNRFISQIAAILAALATAVAMIGLYGVVAYSVVRRTREIGIRMAIGEKPAGIRKMILSEMLMILAIGLMLGIPPALWISKIVEAGLFGVKAYDPLVVLSAMLVAGLASFAAAYLPAWRASRIDPLIALRCE